MKICSGCSRKTSDGSSTLEAGGRIFAACVLLLASACGGRIGTVDITEDMEEGSAADEPGDSGVPAEERWGSDAGVTDHEIAIEEMEMEDPIALADLIAAKLAAERSETLQSARPPESTSQVPTAVENWRLTKRQCLARLDKAGVKYKKPDFETPDVDAPLFLDGPVGGVEIRPHWPQSNNTNAVMDCHLALALVEVANQARALGIKEIHFYSTYRPLRAPPTKCKSGRAGARCRRLKNAYNKSKKRPSQHRAALAIDLRWFITNRDETIDVLEHFDRRSGRPPCDYDASTYEGRLLQKLACELHRERIFNVMLTPNANKAHHNHFHFDITPDATWYIIR